ncbi:MAG: NAD(P)-dependent oxidoreductase [Magnetococcales bacterium]|nr:NAD(P)-dependent oxidoreductase [Magnetococcales bacterium]
MKIAITGATGFIGRHLVAALQPRGHVLILMVRPESVIPESFHHHTLVPLDLHAPPDRLFDRLGQPDLLIHLAWSGLPNYRSLHHFETELPAQYAFLKSWITAGLPRLLVTGTCFEYGMQSGALNEACPTRPDNPYGFAKDQLRQQLQFLQRSHSFHLTWTRLFYLYGPGQGDNALLSQLRRAVKEGASQFNMSGGEQLRDYLPAETVAERLASLALTADCRHGVINLASGQPISVRRLVEQWLQKEGWSIALNLGHYPYPDHEPMAFWGDCTKLHQALAESV